MLVFFFLMKNWGNEDQPKIPLTFFLKLSLINTTKIFSKFEPQLVLLFISVGCVATMSGILDIGLTWSSSVLTVLMFTIVKIQS